MSFRPIDPLQGTKLVIEGPYAKSGKTLLAVYLTLTKLNKSPEIYGYGNLQIDHDQYEKRTKLGPEDFDPDKQYIVVLDELDVNYPWQKSHWNEGILAFWGYGASHNKCAIIATLQHEYAELAKKLLRQYHIIMEKVLFNHQTNLPYAIAGHFVWPREFPFTQNIENALFHYDPYEKDVSRVNFSEFTPKVLERGNGEEKSTTVRLHGNQLKAMQKVFTHLVDKYGNISAVARKTKVSRNFIYDIMGTEE